MDESLIDLSSFREGLSEHRWFGSMNNNRSGRDYVFIRYEQDKRPQPKVLNLSDVLLWHPFPKGRDFWGHYVLRRTVENCPGYHIPLGVAFAEAMIGKPWPTEWATIRFVACMGTFVTFSKYYSPMYPRLKRAWVLGEEQVSFQWKISTKLNKSERVALFKMPAS